jgi:microcystin-dependent protein
LVESTTQHYGWTKPEITKSSSTWGGFLNADLDSIDALVFANQQGLTPIGSITMFGGATAPANWLFCQGQSLSTTGTYAALFAVFGYAFGGSGANFNLPNLQGKFPLGVTGAAAPGAAGGASTVALATANLPAHTHTVTQVAHSHSASQPAHVHPDPGHAHTISDPQHSHGGAIVSGGQYSLGIAGGLLIGGPSSVAPNPTNIQINAAVTNLQAAGADAVTVAATTPSGPTATGSAGSGTPLPLPLPPYLTINFIVRYQ